MNTKAEGSPVRLANPETGVAIIACVIAQLLQDGATEMGLGHIDHVRDCFKDIGVLVGECIALIDNMMG